jgi:hypothetical protein
MGAMLVSLEPSVFSTNLLLKSLILPIRTETFLTNTRCYNGKVTKSSSSDELELLDCLLCNILMLSYY